MCKNFLAAIFDFEPSKPMEKIDKNNGKIAITLIFLRCVEPLMVKMMEKVKKQSLTTTNAEPQTTRLCKNSMDKLCKTIQEMGLTVIGSKGCGKSNAVLCIIKNLTQNSVVCSVDFATVHAFELGKEFTVKFLNENYLIKKPHIDLDSNIIIDISQTTKPIASEIIRELIKAKYYERVKEVITTFQNGSKVRKLYRPWLIFVLEEAQTTIGKFSKEDSDLRTAMAVGRNYRINFIFITQRLSELDTALSERSAYLIGKTQGDNNLRKLSNLLGIPRRKLKFVETLAKGEFLFYNGEGVEKLKFPLYNGSRVSIESEVIKRKPKNLWQKLKDAFNQPQRQRVLRNLTEMERDSEELSHEDSEGDSLFGGGDLFPPEYSDSEEEF